MSGKTDKGFRWMKYIMWLWLASAGVKAIFGLFGGDPGKSIAEAIVLVIAAFVITGCRRAFKGTQWCALKFTQGL